MRAPNDNYTNSALAGRRRRHYPQRLVGEFIGTVVSNEWVNDEYKHVVLKVHEHALKAYAGQMFHLLCPSPDGAEVWMRRPMSVYRVDKAAGQVEFLYKTEGRGTRGMATLAAGRRLQHRRPARRRLQARAGLEEYRGARPRRRARDAGAAVAACGGAGRRRDRDPERAPCRRRDVEGAVRGSRRAHHHGARFRQQQRGRERREDPRGPDRARARPTPSSPAAPTAC